MCAYPSDLVRTKNWGSEVLTDTDLEGQFDLIITWLDSFADETSGHSHDGTGNEGPKIALASCVSGTLPVTNGGTGQATLAAFLNLIYPVGTIYTNKSDSTNPGTLLGFGTWTAIEGRVVVGYKAGDSDFGTPEAEVGASTVTLTAAQSGLPAHTHSIYINAAAGATESIGSGSASTNGSAAISTAAVSAASASESHSNIQPSIVCYVWERTA